MGTRSITFIRKRIPKEISSATKSSLGGPDESQYIYEYFVCMYHHWDGYVRGGVGEWLTEFLCKFLHEYSSKYMDTGFLAAKFVKAFMEKEAQYKRLLPLTSLEEMFRTYDYHLAYIITTDSTRKYFDNKSIMLTAYQGGNIITTRPEKFMTKYLQYEIQMEGGLVKVIDYGDDEIEKEGYLAEDRLFLKFIQTKLYQYLYSI
jgi:hypothetical protein